MAERGRTIRLFVSSTFSDLKAERNALQERVFPALRRLCRGHGWELSVIDLRWGVTDEAALDQQTMRICLEEVARCQATRHLPNFLILLGDRYGWVPLPAELPAPDLAAIRQVTQDAAGLALLDDWYKLDENSIPPSWRLQPRLGDRAAFADWGAWSPVESRLRTLFREALDRLGWTETQRAGYETSATEKEIRCGALDVPDAQKHVFAFCRRIVDLPPTPAARDFLDLREDGSPDEAAAARLTALRQAVADKLGPQRVFSYEARWEGSRVSTDHLDRLCREVEEGLGGIIRAQMAGKAAATAWEVERGIHLETAEAAADGFLGREAYLQRIARYLAAGGPEAGLSSEPASTTGSPSADGVSPPPSPILIIRGPSGMGKSALLGRAIVDRRRTAPEALLLARLIGVTPASQDLRSLLTGLLQELSGSAEIPAVPGQVRDLIRGFWETLARTASRGPVCLVLDGLDQLSEAGQPPGLGWLPNALPEGVRLLVSAADGSETMGLLERRWPPECFLVLSPMSGREAAPLLERWLATEGRTLTPSQVALVMARFADQGNPLYLRLCLEEVRYWESYRLAVELAAEPAGLFRQLMRRWAVRHGAMLSERALAYLAASRFGLSEEELGDLLAYDSEFFTAFLATAHHDLPAEGGPGSGKRLPTVILARWLADLRPFLAETGQRGAVLLRFFHALIGRVVREELLDSSHGAARHAILADWWADQPAEFPPDGEPDPRFSPPPARTGAAINLRRPAELPFQLAGACAWERLAQLLTDLDFIRTKCLAGQTHDLVQDFRLWSWAPGDPPKEVREFAAFVRRQAHVLDRFPALAFQQALAEPAITAPSAAAQVRIKDLTTPFLTWTNKPDLPDPCRATLAGHPGPIRTCVWTVEGLLVTGGDDGQIWIWDAETGARRAALVAGTEAWRAAGCSADGRTLALGNSRGDLSLLDPVTGILERRWEAHLGEIVGCGFLDAGLLYSAGADGRVKLWGTGGDLLREVAPTGEARNPPRLLAAASTRDGTILAVGGEDRRVRLYDEALSVRGALPELGGWIRCLAFFPGSHRLVAGTTDGHLQIYEVESGRKTVDLPAHSDWVRACSVSPDGQWILTGGGDRTVRLWDAGGMPVASFPGHTARVNTVAWAPTGNLFLSGSADGTARIWEPGGREPSGHPGEGHTRRVTALVFTASGSAVSASEDGTLRTWQPAGSLAPSTLNGGKGGITCLTRLPGNRVVSGSSDGTLLIWDLAGGQEPLALEGHAGEVTACDGSPDGRQIISASLDGSLRQWDSSTGACLQVLTAHEGPIRAVRVSPGGSLLLSCSDDRTARIWDLTEGRERHTLRGHTEQVRTGVFTPDGGLVVTGSTDGTTRWWDPVTGNAIRLVAAHAGPVSVAAVLPDGSQILTGGGDGMVRLWDAAWGELRREFRAHRSPIVQAVVALSGELIGSASLDGVIHLWRPMDGEVVATWAAAGPVRALAFSDDGNVLAAGETSGQVYLLQIRNLARTLPLAWPWQGASGWLGLRRGRCAFRCPSCGVWNALAEAGTAVVRCSQCQREARTVSGFVAADPGRFLS